MKKDDIVTIYRDPLTENKKEGQAKLLKHRFNTGSAEYWKVKFLGGGGGNPITHRFIKKE